MGKTEEMRKQMGEGTSTLEPPSAFMNPIDQVRESNSLHNAFKKKFV